MKSQHFDPVKNSLKNAGTSIDGRTPDTYGHLLFLGSVTPSNNKIPGQKTR